MRRLVMIMRALGWFWMLLLVTATLLTDDEAGARAESVCTTSDLWERALASGTRDAAVDAAVDACLDIAAGTLDPVHASFVDGLRGQAAPGAMYDAGSVEGLVRGLIEPG